MWVEMLAHYIQRVCSSFAFCLFVFGPHLFSLFLFSEQKKSLTSIFFKSMECYCVFKIKFEIAKK